MAKSSSNKKAEETVDNLPVTQQAGGLPADGDLMAQFAKDEGKGRSKDVNDYAIPFLAIAQSNSPQLKPTQGKFIEGLAQGGIFNTVTGRFWPADYGLPLIPVGFKRVFLEWVPRDQGGGLVAIHDIPTGMELEKTLKEGDQGKKFLPNGNQLSDARQHFVMVYDPEEGVIERAAMSLASTQIKKSRMWQTIMENLKVPYGDRLINPPSFAQIFKATTVPESNKRGEWYGWKFVYDRLLADSQLYKQVREFSEAVEAGAVEVRADTLDAGGAGEDSDEAKKHI